MYKETENMTRQKTAVECHKTGRMRGEIEDGTSQLERLMTLLTDTGGSRIAPPPRALTGVQGQRPLAGVARGSCVGKFCISELNSRNLVHTFYEHYIVNIFIYFQ